MNNENIHTTNESRNNNSFESGNLYIPSVLNNTIEPNNRQQNDIDNSHQYDNDDSSFSSPSICSRSSSTTMSQKDKDLVKSVLYASNITIKSTTDRTEHTMKYHIIQCTKHII